MDRPPPASGFLRVARLCLPIALGTTLLSSCVSAPSDPSAPSPSEDTAGNGSEAPSDGKQAIATSLYSASAEGSNLRFDIFSLERHSDEMVVLSMAVTNDGTENAQVMHSLTELGGQASSPDGVSLIDTANQKRYMPLKLTDGKTCHCSSWAGSESLPPGGTIETWVAFPAPPSGTDQVVVTTPVTPDFLDIPITEAVTVNNDIANAPVGEPRILDIRAFEDDIDSGSSRSDSGDEAQVLLSSDVLFELNQSELTSEADGALEAVAEEINASSATIVQIDGYTDNSGNDAINIPLSNDRAIAVKQRLEELITREGVSFEVAGHGSSNPIGDNTTEEGREKNRRVTITFAK
ncbi:outer membrane protein OmpA-like peptidoglycan-associated protein [Actinorugispora endophytica]|uniref:Outer membrane protein OmpA-like peptidoglycan-associated protein n=1 Tax=Actinorugispora endophytica TaxID=1605990 RepID=A0A4V3D7U6_9ACTN|nr:outer membrane protein OmpA-like peptidoglycan-associated protein [Actinorugispora endophytica]